MPVNPAWHWHNCESVDSISTDTTIDMNWVAPTCKSHGYHMHTRWTNTRSLRNTLTCFTCIASKPCLTLACKSVDSISTDTTIETRVGLTIINICKGYSISGFTSISESPCLWYYLELTVIAYIIIQPRFIQCYSFTYIIIYPRFTQCYSIITSLWL